MDEMKKFLVTQYSGTRLHNVELLRNCQLLIDIFDKQINENRLRCFQ